ncbi:GntR family transcriptional regulator [Labrys monachus]|uniref:GntR family transcriptional regulator n=1 Tax=Labrys monachus TaxID=217067 RepID=UPI0027D819AC|nr:GntR family transcriptional regulator [Labrys monachus]
MWNDPLPKSSPLPLWFQIAERLRDAIAQGVFPPGDVVPSEAKLNEIFGISRATSRAALDRLEQEGLINRRSGKGSVVLSPKVSQPAAEMFGFSDDMRRRGLQPSHETLFAGRVRATAEAAEALGTPVNTPLFQSRRLLKADGVPICIAVSWLSPDLFRSVAPPTAAELSEGSLYAWLGRKCDVTLTGAREFIEAAIVGDEMAGELQIAKGSAVLIVRRRSHARGGAPMEYAVLHFRADRYRLQLETGEPA